MKKYYAILIGCVALFVLSASIVVTASTIQASTNVTLQSVASLEKETLSFKCEITNFNNTNKKIKSYSDKQANKGKLHPGSGLGGHRPGAEKAGALPEISGR